jgi:hypothetical protein
MRRAAPLTAQTAPAVLPAPITEAASGQLQCYAPNLERKVCQSLAAYRLNAAGGIDNIASVLISPSPVVVIRTVSPVTIREGKVCGPLRAEDFDAATFTVEGRPAADAVTADLRAQVKASFAPMFGHEVCTAYAPRAGGGLTAQAWVDGQRQETLDQPVIWVKPADGYRVAP